MQMDLQNEQGENNMYGYEMELQRQRAKSMQAEAHKMRMINHGRKPLSNDLRRMVGNQLVRIGTRLRGDI